MAIDTHRAVVFSGTRGKPSEVLSVKTIPKPTPSTGQVLVRVLYVPIHPSTLAGIQPGLYPGPAADGILSGEGVGIIEAHGPDTVGAPPVKTRVLLASAQGTFAEYVLLSATKLIPVPDSISNHNAAQFIVNPLSAYLLVHSNIGVFPKRGEWLLQTGASSVLAKNVIQLARHFGFKTINVIRNSKHTEDLKAVGADAVICTDTEDIAARVSELTNGEGVKYAIDPVGGEFTSTILKTLSYGGKLVVFGQLDKADIHFPSGLLVVKLLTIVGFWLTDWFKTAPADDHKAAFADLFNLFATGVLNCPVEKEYTLDELVPALEAAVTPGRGGKVLLKFT